MSAFTNVLQFCGFGEVIPGNDEEGGEVDPGILVGLHLKPFTVPIDGAVQTLLICVLRLHELVLRRERKIGLWMRYEGLLKCFQRGILASLRAYIFYYHLFICYALFCLPFPLSSPPFFIREARLMF